MGKASCREARPSLAGKEWTGWSRKGSVGCGIALQGRLWQAQLSVACLGGVWLGADGPCLAWQEQMRSACSCPAKPVIAGHC